MQTTKPSYKKVLLISTITLLLAVIAGLSYYSYTLNSELAAQRNELANKQSRHTALAKQYTSLEKKVAALELTQSTQAATETSEEAPATQSEEEKIMASARAFSNAFVPSRGEPTLISHDDNFANLTFAYGGFTMKKSNDIWVVVHHGQSIGQDEAAMFGIPINE